MSVYLKPGIPVVLSQEEAEPIIRAAGNLQRDLQLVFGAPSPMIPSLDKLGDKMAKDRTALVIIGPESNSVIGKQRWVAEREAHQVFMERLEGIDCIVIQGADIRGTLYAIYTFSEHLLGIPPLWFWASWKAKRQTQIEVPDDFDLRYESPHVKYRAWFPNDTSRLTPWRQLHPENDIIWAETMLRLKLNTIVLDNLLSDGAKLSSSAKIARSHGLIIASTHISPFGRRLGENWNDYWGRLEGSDVPKLSLADPDRLFEMWALNRDSLLKQSVEIVWTIAFRGIRDQPFWEAFDDAPATEEARAAVIQSMLNRQLNLLRENAETAGAPVRVTLYNEVSDFYAKGLLELPKDSSLIYNFVAARRDHYPPERIRELDFGNHPLGYYLNFQFTSTGSHFAQAEGPWKMEKNLRMISDLSSAPLEFVEVNMGNIREHVIEGAASARMMWDWDRYDSEHFLKEFFQHYFGGFASDRIAAIYKQFLASYWSQRKPSIAGFERQYLFQDLRCMRTLRILLESRGGKEERLARDEFLRIYPEDLEAETVFEALLKGTEQSIGKLKEVLTQADLAVLELEEDRISFFNDTIRLQIQYMLNLNEALYFVVAACGIRNFDSAEACRLIREGEQSFTSALKALLAQEHGRFATWFTGMSKPSYHYRTILGIQEAFQETIKQLQGNYTSIEGDL